MKKVGRFSLFELQDASSVIDKASQKTFIGGGSGSSSDPYTQDEFDSMMYSGHWNGGWVYGMGWITPQVYIYPNHYNYSGSYHPSGHGGGGSFWPGSSWPGNGGNTGGYLGYNGYNPNHNNYYHGHNGYWGHNGYSNHYGYPGFYGYHFYGGGGGGITPSENNEQSGVIDLNGTCVYDSLSELLSRLQNKKMTNEEVRVEYFEYLKKQNLSNEEILNLTFNGVKGKYIEGLAEYLGFEAKELNVPEFINEISKGNLNYACGIAVIEVLNKNTGHMDYHAVAITDAIRTSDGKNGYFHFYDEQGLCKKELLEPGDIKNYYEIKYTD